MVEQVESLVDTPRAAAFLGISPVTLGIWRSQRKAGQPPYIKVGRAVRYRMDALREWAEVREGTKAASERRAT